jgi:hypothetical protein
MITASFIAIIICLVITTIRKDEKTDPPGMFSLNMPVDGSVVENPEDILLAWSESPESTGYSVFVREIGMEEPIIKIESIKEPRCRVSLEPNKNYEWTVFSFNPYGVKSPSVTPFRFTTKHSNKDL